MKICLKGVFELFLASDGVFGEAFKPMPSWPFKLEWEIFDCVKIITAGHVDVKEIVFGDLMIHYFICEA